MPQKRNADPMELARGKAGRLIGNMTGLLVTLKGLPAGYNKDLQEDKEPLFDTFDTLDQVMPAIAGMVAALTFNTLQMRAALDDGMLSTELADWLVLYKNLPFREAHHLIGQAVKLAEARGVGLQDLSLDDYRGIDARFDELLFDVLDVDAAINKRRNDGGTSPEAVQRVISSMKVLLDSEA